MIQKPLVLDCTLRDGGYVNNFSFGIKTIKNIIRGLVSSHIDIIEVGFLKDEEFNEDRSIFNSVENISHILPINRANSIFVAMIAFGEIPIEKISNYFPNSIDGIRLTFHKPDLVEALQFAMNLKEKGYKIFIQPVGINSYSDFELIELIISVNKIAPYAFYIVDTLGILNKKSITYLFGLVDNNLSKDIKIGYHSHNNLQLAFSNAQEMIEWSTNRSIILDSSILGMGRGAGNLCTELIIYYINSNILNSYNPSCILELIDNEILRIFSETPWGYNTPYFLSSMHKCHPNYATFLLSKQTIPATSINNILSNISDEKRDLYDKDYIEFLYKKHLSSEIDDSYSITKLRELFCSHSVLILGAGMSVIKEKSIIDSFVKKENPLVVSVNFIDPVYDQSSNVAFFSNSKKFIAAASELTISKKTLIVTSNILSQINFSPVIPINYSSLLLSNENVFDNAGLMLINLLLKLGVTNIFLAGFDGFSNSASDYINQHLFFNEERKDIIDRKNLAMREEINKFKKLLNISFITNSLYD